MDVLQYHRPDVDWQKFKRSPLSEDVWGAFRDAVLLCHAFKYWGEAERQGRSTRPRAALRREQVHCAGRGSRSGSSRTRGTRTTRSGQRSSRRRAWAIAHMVQDRSGTPDWHFSLALIKAVPSIMNTVTGHERAEFGVLAFEEFDAASEVGTNSDAMVRRWRPAVRRAQAGA